MDIPKLSMANAENQVMTAVNTKMLGVSLDNMEKTGEQITDMIESSAPAQVMNSQHIDLTL